MSLIRVVVVAMLGVALLVASPVRAQQAPVNLDAVAEKMPFDVPYGAPISLERAQAAIAVVVAEAKKRDWKMNITVVDSGGNLVAFQRMDGAQLASIQISEHKARYAATWRRESKVAESGIQLGGDLSPRNQGLRERHPAQPPQLYGHARRDDCVPRRHSTRRGGQDHRCDRLFGRCGFTG